MPVSERKPPMADADASEIYEHLHPLQQMICLVLNIRPLGRGRPPEASHFQKSMSPLLFAPNRTRGLRAAARTAYRHSYPGLMYCGQIRGLQ